MIQSEIMTFLSCYAPKQETTPLTRVTTTTLKKSRKGTWTPESHTSSGSHQKVMKAMVVKVIVSHPAP